MYLQKAREKHRKINIILAILAFCCILYGTFLTRSGVLADFSVHSFVDLGITGWLVAIIVVFLVGGLGAPRLPLEGDPGRQRDRPGDRKGEGGAVPVALRPLHPLGDALLRLGPRHPPRHVGPDHHAHRRQGRPRWRRASTTSRTRPSRSSWRSSSPSCRSSPGAARRGRRSGRRWRWRPSSASSASSSSSSSACGSRSTSSSSVRPSSASRPRPRSSSSSCRRKAIRSAGRLLRPRRHVAIMLVGILISGAYEMKTQVTLRRDQPLVIENHGRPVTLHVHRPLLRQRGRRREDRRPSSTGRSSPTGAPSRRWRSPSPRARRSGRPTRSST